VDPTKSEADVSEQAPWPLDDIEGWAENIVDGIVTAGPERTQIGGRDAVYFEVEIASRDVCRSDDFCIGFVISTIDEFGGISGWAFELGFHHRIWWVDGGDEPPVLIIAATASADRSFQVQADELLDALVIGDPQPHPAG
jgi:hypothetical protein